MNLLLNSGWKLNYRDKKGLDTNVPCSLYSVMLDYNLIEDPFNKDNEYKIREMSRYDCDFTRELEISDEDLKNENIEIIFHGVDTIADFYVNEVKIGSMNNMHRIWIFDIKEFIKKGENLLRVHIKSPIKYIEEADEKYHLWGVDTTMEGYPHIRKAHCMFGWDWGPQLPDMGIYRDVELRLSSFGIIDNIYVTQDHEDGKVKLSVNTELHKLNSSNLKVQVTVTSPDSEKISSTLNNVSYESTAVFNIENPMLWWPNGYGKQYLYNVEVNLIADDKVIDTKKCRVGLRTLKLSRKKDKWGREFCFEVNGVKIFAMGANYIIEDNILPRRSKDKTELLIKDCAKCNYNTIRVWGGALYPEDYFFDLCDEYGLIVWEDFMFACSMYILTNKFESNVKAEFIDVIKRIRNHASLGLLCGNNEIESAIHHWGGLPDDKRLKEDYITLFERIIPEICEEYIPSVSYWPSSPSIGGGFNNPDLEDEGDEHYWDVWHGNKPFKDFRKYFYRFCSEFGFESFPDMKTIKTFADEEDMNPFSYIMESHQKCKNGNSKLMNYLGDNYLYPSNFENLIYSSQLLQSDAIRYAVEHFRRFRGRCMGTTYWQVNDCWPCPSWASRDYYGRWKALQYASRKFFAPVLLSAHDEEYDVTFNISNETFKTFKGKIKCYIKDNNLNEISCFTFDSEVGSFKSKDIVSLNVEEYIKGYERSRFLVFNLEDENGKTLSSETMLFAAPKHFKFLKPEIHVSVEKHETEFIINVSADKYVKGLEINFDDIDCILSDNFFDISSKDTVKVSIEEVRSGSLDLEDLKENIRIRSVYDIDK